MSQALKLKLNMMDFCLKLLCLDCSCIRMHMHYFYPVNRNAGEGFVSSNGQYRAESEIKISQGKW